MWRKKSSNRDRDSFCQRDVTIQNACSCHQIVTGSVPGSGAISWCDLRSGDEPKEEVEHEETKLIWNFMGPVSVKMPAVRLMESTQTERLDEGRVGYKLAWFQLPQTIALAPFANNSPSPLTELSAIYAPHFVSAVHTRGGRYLMIENECLVASV